MSHPRSRNTWLEILEAFSNAHSTPTRYEKNTKPESIPLTNALSFKSKEKKPVVSLETPAPVIPRQVKPTTPAKPEQQTSTKQNFVDFLKALIVLLSYFGSASTSSYTTSPTSTPTLRK